MKLRKLMLLWSIVVVNMVFIVALRADETTFYHDWSMVLTERVDVRGLVDYAGLKSDIKHLNAFLYKIGTLSPTEFEKFNAKKQVAFWINVYNAMTIKAIIDNYPIKPTFPAKLYYPKNSIRQIKGVWKKNNLFVMGRKVSLNEIEQDILRKKYYEPGIHMALVCASMTCPYLRNEPYYGYKLEYQIADQARRFMRSPVRFKINRTKNTVYISKIFDWYGNDFIKGFYQPKILKGLSKKKNAVINYISGFVPDTAAAFLIKSKYQIEYLNYNWTLNEQESSEGRR